MTDETPGSGPIRYRVRVTEVVLYDVYVETDSTAAAEGLAIQTIIDADNRDETYFYAVQERSAEVIGRTVNPHHVVSDETLVSKLYDMDPDTPETPTA